MRNNIVSVLFNKEEVGQLYWDARLKRAVFSYNPSFVKKGLDIAPFLADSLPDRWGNKVFEKWAAQNRIPMRNLTPVDKLSFIGKRGMGAFEFAPATEGLETSSAVQIDSLYQLAREIFEERKEHFLTERFDRKEGRKIHTQTLAAMSPEASSYEELFAICRKLNISAVEISEMFRRMVFNVLAANVDGAVYENGHSLTILGKAQNITPADLTQFAKENSIKNDSKIIAEISTAISHFYNYASKYQVNQYWADRIEQHLSQTCLH